VAAFIVLLHAPVKANATPFSWNRDQLWQQLEQQFVEARAGDCNGSVPMILLRIQALAELAATVETQTLGPDDPLWDDAEDQMFRLATRVAACHKHLDKFTKAVTRLQQAVKRQAIEWPADRLNTRRRLYRIIYGGRTALEGVLLQSATSDTSEVLHGKSLFSAAPSVTIHGVTIHSGDMLVTRGGAATSALIARGSDYPGNFSHVALAHVDAQTGQASVIEALIEYGVVISTAAEFLEDKKMRIMVLRLRPDLPAVIQNPTIAHEAAQWAYDAARRRTIDYDFAMDFSHHDKLFCAEVVYAAYEKIGIQLWTGLSHISAPGTTRWLEAFGVKNFITLEPSDLEYDPQLNRVAEWHNPETLLKDHIHNAVTDVMLEGANAGAPIKYNRLMLPLAWGAKLYSIVQTKRGRTGPIPKGMSCAAALRNKWYSKQHARGVDRVTKSVQKFTQQKGYSPPYWELVRMAREHLLR
jgi:hypothetical protein